MTTPGFLLDEHIPAAVGRAFAKRDPAIQVFAVGRPPAPAFGAADPELLRWIEDHNCLLVTNNRASMPTHLRDHLGEDRHVPGILVTSKGLSLGELGEQLLLVWGAGLPGEFHDQIV
ncbi:MAG TPA: hypothetical protein VNL16_18160 [Chloroflexota bacterium]|nr:hypothetical protein [Chloroflexota bacterium]